MDYLLYSSKEMFSSTDLIRKSKMIFDKVGNGEINKAIILRDGKPSFIMLDFDMYEEMMKEYIALKNGEPIIPQKRIVEEQKVQVESPKKEIIRQVPKQVTKVEVEESVSQDDEEAELLKTLKALDDMDFEEEEKEVKSLDEFDDEEVEDYEDEDIDDVEVEIKTSKEQPLKDFWEK